ncbi:2-amino-4-hydroxy-6-hydroxymethyldihydropteridine diphosphokinase [Pelagibacterales bacterium SAG-MED39]|nr:2-amino-4-hydroxy-6-hydroxymethyldihydropteridine diphosphokinase [Pelagibacterales bacterium SAG-MED39]
MLENQAKSIYLAIGSNLGNKKKNIEKAKLLLMKNNIEILRVSNFYESFSWPNPMDPKFLNIVLKIDSNLSPLKLLKKCKEIELKLGRKKSSKNSPRECDIDILDYKTKRVIGEIILPHPRMHTRNFVLIPLFEINKHWVHPITNDHIKKLILLLSNRDITSIKQI